MRQVPIDRDFIDNNLSRRLHDASRQKAKSLEFRCKP
jgi:hypothetical protein